MTPLPPDQPEPGTDNLRRAVATLPTHEPAPATWSRIAAQLAADQALPGLVAALPAHEPADDLWAGIAGRLDAAGAVPLAPPARLRTRRARPAPAWRLARGSRRVLALAASLVLLVLAGGWWQLHRPAAPGVARTRVAPAPAGPRETLTVSEETVDMPLPATLPAPAADALESQGLAFIKKGCTRQPSVCSSTEFQNLNTQLAELQAQEQELRQASRRFGSSPELAREQTRLVNLQASVERQLINMLLS